MAPDLSQNPLDPKGNEKASSSDYEEFCWLIKDQRDDRIKHRVKIISASPVPAFVYVETLDGRKLHRCRYEMEYSPITKPPI